MLIKSETISQAWEKSIIELLKCKHFISTQRGMRALELRNVLFEVEKPFAEPRVSPRYQFSRRFIEAYCDSVRDSFKGESIRARIYEFGDKKINQYAVALNSLKASYNTRRAIISLWNPNFDHKSRHPPCALILQFLCREGRLHLTTFLRSNDAWIAALPDMMALSEIQKQIASELNLSVGTYNQLSVSYHVYEPDVAIADSIFGSG